MIRSSVLLPAPDGPSTATISPSSTCSDTPSSTVRSPKLGSRHRRHQASSEPSRSWLPETITITVVSTSRIVAIANACARGRAPARAEQPADRDRQGLAARAGQDRRGTELAERDGCRETLRPPGAADAGRARRPATTLWIGVAPNVAAAARRSRGMERSTDSMARTTNGTATSAWPSGTSHHCARQSNGRRVERDQHAETDRHRRRAERQHQACIEKLAESRRRGDRGGREEADDRGDQRGDDGEPQGRRDRRDGVDAEAGARPHLGVAELASTPTATSRCRHRTIG